MWKRLDHVNIVPFKGATLEPLQLVLGWMDGGELREYIRTNRDADLISLVSLFRHRPVFINIQTSSRAIISRVVSLTVSFTFIHAM